MQLIGKFVIEFRFWLKPMIVVVFFKRAKARSYRTLATISFIFYLLSFIFYLLSFIFYLLSFIFYLLSFIFYLFK